VSANWNNWGDPIEEQIRLKAYELWLERKEARDKEDRDYLAGRQYDRALTDWYDAKAELMSEELDPTQERS